MKTNENFNLTNFDTFAKVMGQPENICPLLEALIGKTIDRIVPARRHELLGVHVNAFTHDGFTYDTSLQLVENDDLGKRLRASQAIMDADFLSPDNFGDETLRSCVIFICKNAPNSRGKAVRRIQKVIHTLNDIPFDDGTSAFILNMSYTERNAADLVCEFLRWMDACRKGEVYDASGSEYLKKLINWISFEMTLPIHALSGLTVLAVPGVNALQRLEESLTELRAQGVREIKTAFDMDYVTNCYVQSAYEKLLALLGRMGFRYGTYVWDPQYKGLDDFIWAKLNADLDRKS